MKRKLIIMFAILLIGMICVYYYNKQEYKHAVKVMLQRELDTLTVLNDVPIFMETDSGIISTRKKK